MAAEAAGAAPAAVPVVPTPAPSALPPVAAASGQSPTHLFRNALVFVARSACVSGGRESSEEGSFQAPTPLAPLRALFDLIPDCVRYVR